MLKAVLDVCCAAAVLTFPSLIAEQWSIDDRESLPAAWLHGLVDTVQAQRAAVDLKQVLWLSSLVGFGSATDVDPNWKACC